MDAFAGEFEIHLTVDCSSPAVRTDTLAALVAERGWKYAYIVLARGRTPVQPMVTFTVDSGQLGAAWSAAQAAAAELAAVGCPVVRVKVESAPWAHGVPATDAEGLALGPAYYFEHHVKLLLPTDTDTAELAQLAVRNAAHLSRNARRVRDDGQREQFVTQRCHEVGSATAGRRLDALLAALTSLPYETLAVEREFVVYDSAEALDTGWLTEVEDARP
ncbi:hypothetical protein HC362_05375 [Streptomyces sp. 891-h]|nr:hypothetical protein HC362_05375 [Streptomyces sp. 891-h]